MGSTRVSCAGKAVSARLGAIVQTLQEVGSGDPLCDFAATLGFADLPESVRTLNKLAILDTFGAAIAGARFAEGGEEVRAYARSAGHGGHSTLWATGERCAPGLAALVNATHARGLDYDDIIPFPQIHLSVHVVPALVALAEARRAPVTGRDFLVATVVGCEVQARLTRAIAPFFGAGLPALLSSQIFGYFSAALACGRLMRLDPRTIRNAFGLALMHAAGTEEMVVHATRSMGKMLYAGLSNQGGLQCAMMAASGITAEGNPLNGSAGLFATFYGGRYDEDALTRHLGSEFQSLNRCFKSAPGTLVGHSFAEAAALLKRELGASPDDISKIVLCVGSWGRAMCEPIEVRRHPPSASAAMNSIPFVVAKAVANGAVHVGDFQEGGRSQPSARDIASRIQYEFSPALSKADGLEEATVEFVMSNGAVFRKTIRVPLGHPDRPLSVDQAIEKFRQNIAFSHRHSLVVGADELVERILNVEKDADIAAFIGSAFGPSNNGVQR
jgi:2-methylcitrate dehydratase PrpD